MASVFSMHGSGMSGMGSKNESKYKFKKGDKAPKDENAPKKPLSAYFRFAEEKRKPEREKNPGATVGQVMKVIGALWKQLSAEEKEKYDTPAKKAKSTYDKLLAAYKHSGAYAEFQEKLHEFKIFETTLPYKKDPNMPKKALSAYMIYTNSIREEINKENPGIKVTDVMRKCGQKWKELSDDDKAEWTQKAEAKKAEHEKTKAAYLMTSQRTDYENEKEAYLAKQKKDRKRLKRKRPSAVDESAEDAPVEKPKKRAKKEQKANKASKPKAPKSKKSKSKSKGSSKSKGAKDKAKKSKKARKPARK